MDARLRRKLHSAAGVTGVGIGDEIMAAGEARRVRASDPRKVRILGVDGAPRWHPIWDGNPSLAKLDELGDFQIVRNGPNARPYIAGKNAVRWTWKAFETTPGEIYFTDAELEFARDYRPQIVIEPTIKKGASVNKQWGHDRWERLSRMAIAAGYAVTQVGAQQARVLPGAAFILTPDFRRAAAVLANARLYVGPDGGLMHAAAALGVPAIVIRGAFVSERCTGYSSQRNFYSGPGLGCGMRIRCPCCIAAMAKITPEAVLSAVGDILQ